MQAQSGSTLVPGAPGCGKLCPCSCPHGWGPHLIPACLPACAFLMGFHKTGFPLGTFFEVSRSFPEATQPTLCRFTGTMVPQTHQPWGTNRANLGTPSLYRRKALRTHWGRPSVPRQVSLEESFPGLCPPHRRAPGFTPPLSSLCCRFSFSFTDPKMGNNVSRF